MAKIWLHFFVLIWFTYLIGSAIHLFAKGFLLTRQVQTERNHCKRLKSCDSGEQNDCPNQNEIDDILKNVNSSSDYCLPQKSRVILLVIDAMKYEFGVYDEDNKNPRPYQNKVPILNQLLTDYPDQTRLMKFMADAPTTTLQRLKGITTGSLPTFIDAGSNFATPEINEDNILDQLITNGHSAVLLGDDTWTHLFPDRFIRQYSFPSLNIMDLDTIDDGINKLISSEIKKDDWSLLIAHYLGVDHCGHKFGPNHPEMARKLNEMNGVIKNIIETMDNNTTLYIIGDHGMTNTGEHGGDSDDEVTALMFAYTKKQEFLENSDEKKMEQIDLVPSLAVTLGIPIPYSNLGSINFDIVPNDLNPNLTDAQTRMLHIWSNAKQIRYLFSNYTTKNHDVFSAEKLDDFYIKFYILSIRLSTMTSAYGIDGLNSDIKTYLKDILSNCRDVWVNYDANLISQGLLFTSVVCIFLYVMISNIKPNQFGIVFNNGNVLFIYTSNIGIIVGTYVFHRLFNWDGFFLNAIVYSSVYSIALLAFLLIQNWELITVNWSQHKPFSNIFERCVFIVSSGTFFTNSFIINEQKVLCYLISGLLICFLYKIHNEYGRLALWRKVKPELILTSSFTKLAIATIIGIILLRITYTFHRCREEQANCMDIFMETSPLQINFPIKLSSITWKDFLSVCILSIFVTVFRRFLRKCGNLSGFSSHVLIARYLLIVSAIACGIHSLIKSSGIIKNPKSIWQMRMDALAWIVYTVFIMQLITIVIKPLMVYVFEKEKRSFSVSPFGRVVPQILMKMKQMYEEIAESNDEQDNIPIVYGLATVYSSVFLSSCVAFAMFHSVLLGSFPANGLIAVLFVVFLVLILNAILRYQRCTKLAFCLQPEFTTLVIWCLIAHYCFYATSHQSTLSQIDWHAAFVGRTAVHDNNNIISATLVVLSTFGGQFLIFFLYPLLIIVPTAIFTIYPSLAPRRTTKIVIQNQNGTKQRHIVKKLLDKTDTESVNVNVHKYNEFSSDIDDVDIPRGELTLFENEELFIGSLFQVGSKLIILQGIRIFAAMLACTIHCRHLMVWKIFAPRFIYEGLATYVIFGAIILSFLLVIRIHKALNRLVVTMSD